MTSKHCPRALHQVVAMVLPTKADASRIAKPLRKVYKCVKIRSFRNASGKVTWGVFRGAQR